MPGDVTNTDNKIIKHERMSTDDLNECRLDQLDENDMPDSYNGNPLSFADCSIHGPFDIREIRCPKCVKQSLMNQSYTGTMIADLILSTENVLDKHSGK